MKIEGNNPVIPLSPATANGKKISGSTSSVPVGETEDRTTLHTDTQSVQALTTQAMQTPEIRQDKVDALSQSISDGQYQVDVSRIAEGILSSQDL